MKQWNNILKNISLLTQFGLSMITPLLLCLFICWYLNTRLGLPAWVYVVGFFFGLGGSGMVVYKFFLSVKKEEKKDKKKTRISFNDHV